MTTTNPKLTAQGRDFVDAGGRAWHVGERSRRCGDGTQTTLLVFESEVSFRCVSSFPSDWATLDDRSLEALSWRT